MTLININVPTSLSGADVCLEGLVCVFVKKKKKQTECSECTRKIDAIFIVAGSNMWYTCLWLIQVATDPLGEAVSTQSPTCSLILPSPPAVFPPPSPPPPGDVVISVSLVDDNLQSVISLTTNVPIAGFQFDVVDSKLNPVIAASE